VNRLEVRVVSLEAASRRGWRAFIGRPVEQWPDEALLGFLGEVKAGHRTTSRPTRSWRPSPRVGAGA
jgi:hypothetical protein